MIGLSDCKTLPGRPPGAEFTTSHDKSHEFGAIASGFRPEAAVLRRSAAESSSPGIALGSAPRLNRSSTAWRHHWHSAVAHGGEQRGGDQVGGRSGIALVAGGSQPAVEVVELDLGAWGARRAGLKNHFGPPRRFIGNSLTALAD